MNILSKIVDDPGAFLCFMMNMGESDWIKLQTPVQSR